MIPEGEGGREAPGKGVPPEVPEEKVEGLK
jgi:hypothetical protein